MYDVLIMHCKCKPAKPDMKYIKHDILDKN